MSEAIVETRVVDDRVFLLGLDGLYRNAMKEHESGELLSAVRKVSARLGVPAANVPVEGYYTESPELTEFFLTMRALQGVPESRRSELSGTGEFERLLEVVSSPIYGCPVSRDKLLPRGFDPLTTALDITPVADWSGERLAEAACRAAIEKDDYSLVGLAARGRDPVVLAALRESVVLVAFVTCFGPEPKIECSWRVDRDLAEQGARFVREFNRLFGEGLPTPEASAAAEYWEAYENNGVGGRCVRLAQDSEILPRLHYHWAIGRGMRLHEFWSHEIYTTERYRSENRNGWQWA